MSSVNYITRTEGQTKINSIIWSVPNFISLLKNKTTRVFRSPKIDEEDATSSPSRFQLKMHFLGIDNDVIEIYYLSPNRVFLKSTLNICLKGFEERSTVTKEYQTVQANKWQYLATLLKRDVSSDDGRDRFLLGDGLRLKFQFMVTNDTIVDRFNVPVSELSNNFGSLLSDGLYPDITIKSAEKTEYKVHRAILACRSAVLRAQLEHNTTECLTNIIESPLESEVLREVLTCIYTDQTPKVGAMLKLLAAADYYQLSRMKSLCEEALHKELTVENAIETLQLADLHSSTTLKRLTLEFIKDGRANLITKTEAWATIPTVLIKTIFEYVVSDDYNVELDQA